MDRLVMVLKFADIFESWVKQVRSYAYRIAEEGNPPPGYKLVQKYGRRKIKDQEKASDALQMLGFTPEELYEPPVAPKIKSPAQLEKLFKKKEGWDKKFLRHFTMAPETGSTLVAENDKRGALVNSVEDDFDVVTD